MGFLPPRLYEFNACFRRIEDPAVHAHQRQLNETDTEVTIETPAGKQIAVHRRELLEETNLARQYATESWGSSCAILIDSARNKRIVSN